jgi:hypothetical protein
MVGRVPRFLGFLLSVILTACGAADSGSTPTPADVPDASTGSSLSFDPDSIITLAPGETSEVRVVVEPPGVHVVRFALLGESLDASLDADEKVTQSDGRTSVTLAAPGSATTFRLRASAGENAVAEVPVSVSGEGFASVRVIPSYKGVRSTPTWTASAVARALCAEVPGEPPMDGPIVGMGIGGAIPVLNGIPVGPNIAITLRSASAVGGCADLSDLGAGETRDVTVKVSDIPVNIAATDLTIEMAMTPDGAAIRPLFDTLSVDFVDDFLDSEQGEAKQVLDAMQDQLGDPADFAEARMMGGWDAVLAGSLDLGGQLLRDRAQAWIQAGLQPLQHGETIIGQLRATSNAGHGVLSLDSFHGLPVEGTGIPRDNIVSLAVEPGDAIIIGGSVTWLPSRLIAAAGDVGAGLLLGDSDALSALANIVGCDELASDLESTYPLPATCDANCIQDACTAGLAALWNAAKMKSSSTFDTVQLSFTVSGTANVNSQAIVVAFDASWLGTQTYGGEEWAVKGDAVAGGEAPHTR